MPTEKAHGIQIAKMCEAFGRRASVALLFPNRSNPIQGSLFDYYHVKERFRIKKLRCLDCISKAPWLGPLAYAIEVFSFGWSLAFYLRKTTQEKILYTRDIYTLLFLSKKGMIVYEAHSLPNKPNWLYRVLLGRVHCVVAITDRLKKDFVAIGVEEKRILVAPDAVDIDLFTPHISKKSARGGIGLPTEKKIVMYTGHLYPWKGVYTLLAAAKRLPEHFFVFVGGTDHDRAAFEKKAEEEGVGNVRIIAHQKHDQVPQYLTAADVLVLPNSAKSRIGAHYTSPMKLFEYMASGTPIVASDVSSLREILSEDTAVFFSPDDSESLARAIEETLTQERGSSARATGARQDAQIHTWARRGQRILDWLSE